MSSLPKSFGIAAAVAFTAAVAAAPFAARAEGMPQQTCAPQEALTTQLNEQFGEKVSAEGVDANGNLVQVFSSETGTWTIAVTLPGGPSCIVSAGEGWGDAQVAEVPEPTQEPGQAS